MEVEPPREERVLEVSNGHLPPSPNPILSSEAEEIKSLKAELIKTKVEKDGFEAQYRSLLGKLTTMRNTLGDKLKQDADELDRREITINELQTANEDLTFTTETLKSELTQSDAINSHLSSELESYRLRASDNQKIGTEEVLLKEIALRETQEDLERVRMKREEWEGEAMRERVRREDLSQRIGIIETELENCKLERENFKLERDREAESAANLHAVLEEFQAAKDRELQSTLGELQNQLRLTSNSLTDYKQRATLAEENLKAVQNDSEKVLDLSREVKEKNLLVGKLRHEAVIQNEHLTEALRRLKKDSNENSVDRRLVSNVLITFLNTPRADTKRFEILNLISSILSWGDEQREMVGLQKTVGGSGGITSSGMGTGGGSGSGGRRGHSRSGKSKATEDGLGENETFSALWIEFLLREVGPNSTFTTPPSLTSPSGSTSTDQPLSPGGTDRFNLADLPPLADIPLRTPTRRSSLIALVKGSGLKSPTSNISSVSEV